MITYVNGSIVKEKQYEAFGNLVYSSGTLEDNREFTSKEKDPTGFHYFGARYYYGDIGRFLTPDPHTVSPGNINLANPQTLNPYVYCTNDPLKYLDPNGLWQTEISVVTSTGYITRESVAGAKFIVGAQVLPCVKAGETLGRAIERDITLTGIDWASSAVSAVPGLSLAVQALVTAVGIATEASRIEQAKQDEMKFKIFGKITGKSLDQLHAKDAYRIGMVGGMDKGRMENHKDIQRMRDIDEFYNQMDGAGWNFEKLSSDQQDQLGDIYDAYMEFNSSGW